KGRFWTSPTRGGLHLRRALPRVSVTRAARRADLSVYRCLYRRPGHRHSVPDPVHLYMPAMFVSHDHDRDHRTGSDSHQGLKQPQHIAWRHPGRVATTWPQPVGVPLLKLAPQPGPAPLAVFNGPIKAKPAQQPAPTDHRVRRDQIDSFGKVTLRYL